MNRFLRSVPLLAVVFIAPACAHHTQRAPALTGAPAPSPSTAPTVEPERQNFLSRTADATWNVVSAPVKLVTPQKAAPAKPPETYDAPDTFIMRPAPDDTPAATQPQ